MKSALVRACRLLPACAAVVLLCFALPAQAQKKSPPGRAGREMLLLDGAWHSLPDAAETGEKQGWSKHIPDGAQTATVPGFALKEAGRVVWYWREFNLPEKWKGQTIRLQCGAAQENADVWINGSLLGAHVGGAVPFEFVLTKSVSAEAKNLLAVRVIGDGNQPPGIWQSVTLISHDEAYLADVFPQAGRAGGVNVPLVLFNASNHAGDATLDAAIFSARDTVKPLRMTHLNLHVSAGRNITTLVTTVPPKKLPLWSPEHPDLFTLALTFRQEADVLDTLRIPFGFREFGIRDGTLTLNEMPLTFNAAAYAGNAEEIIASAPDRERLRASLRAAKARGVSPLYLAAPNPELLTLADEIGLLVVVGPRPDLPAPAALEELRALIRRDRYHACILAWNLAGTDRSGATACRELDPTRFLLVGSGETARLWLPGQDASAAIIPPTGFVPVVNSTSR